jgi:Ser-Thr-rich glycosyl-phosphatidyl-inositol-anchored membrane family protein
MAGLVAAGENPIIYPGTNAQIDAGSTVEITWTPTAGAKITLKLMYGQSQNLQTGTTIACKFRFYGSDLFSEGYFIRSQKRGRII